LHPLPQRDAGIIRGRRAHRAANASNLRPQPDGRCTVVRSARGR